MSGPPGPDPVPRPVQALRGLLPVQRGKLVTTMKWALLVDLHSVLITCRPHTVIIAQGSPGKCPYYCTLLQWTSSCHCGGVTALITSQLCCAFVAETICVCWFCAASDRVLHKAQGAGRSGQPQTHRHLAQTLPGNLEISLLL